MKNTAFMPEYEYHSIIINGKSFNYKIFMSMDDACKMVKEFIKPSSDSKEIVAGFIVNNMENADPSLIDELKEQDNAFYEAVLDPILETDPILKERYICYEKNNDACYKFLNAIKTTYIDPIINSGSAWNNSGVKHVESLERYSKILNSWMSLNETIKTIYNSNKNLFQNLAILSKSEIYGIDRALQVANEISKNIRSLLPSIYFNDFSQEKINKICDSYKSWGQYGWTAPPFSPCNLFYNPPKDKKDADRIALRYCDDYRMDKLFQLIQKESKARKSDIDEAINDFHNKSYKSCALVLFSIMDAKLIRLQKKSELKNNKRRKVGAKAADILFKKIKETTDVLETKFSAFSYYGLSECLNIVFANADDFKVQPEIINRNFLMHGMMHRNVYKRDCVQLFLLYYNFIKLLDLIDY